MHPHRDPLRLLAAGLLIAATIAFVVGTTLERSQAEAGDRQEASTVERSHDEAAEHDETAEHRQAEAAEGRSTEATQAAEQHDPEGEAGERLFGINPEAAGFVAGAAAVSLLLAALLITRPRRPLLVAVVAFGLAFAALDVREAAHQAGESHAELVAIALLTGLLHLAVAVTAAAQLRPPRAQPTTT